MSAASEPTQGVLAQTTRHTPDSAVVVELGTL
jgi:hypothetical protein